MYVFKLTFECVFETEQSQLIYLVEDTEAKSNEDAFVEAIKHGISEETSEWILAGIELEGIVLLY